MTDKQKKWAGRIALAAVVVACVAAYAFIPAVNTFVNTIFSKFASGDFSDMREFIASYGGYAMAISFFLMMFQSVAAPLPAFVITLCNANLFGWWQGAILSWTSAMAGAALCFWIARILGREAVEKLITKTGLESIERFFDRHGKQTILVCRLLPFVSFDFVSYAAGLTSMSFGGFLLATGIGQLPATIVYSYVGGMLTGGAQMLMTALLILFALAVLVVIIKQVYTERMKDKEASAKEASAGEASEGKASAGKASVKDAPEGKTAESRRENELAHTARKTSENASAHTDEAEGSSAR